VSGRVSVQVPSGTSGARADRVVADACGMTRSRVQRLIGEGRLTSGGRTVKANTVLPAGAELTLDIPEETPQTLEAEDIPLSIAYEDEDVLIVDKPSGLVVHPAHGHGGGTLVNALLARGGAGAYGSVAGADRPGIVHRLDRDTSGLLVVARNDRAQRSLMTQLKARRVKKTYLALVGGAVPAEVGRIEAPLGRDPRHPTRVAVVPGGRPVFREIGPDRTPEEVLASRGLKPGAARMLDPAEGVTLVSWTRR
jgi:23S rRNA pseudouridine1911/1915/1917 synthase